MPLPVVDMAGMVNPVSPSATAQPMPLWQWVGQSLLAGAVTGSLATLAILAAWQPIRGGVVLPAVAIALVVALSVATLNSLRFRAIPLLSTVAGAVTTWQWSIHAPSHSTLPWNAYSPDPDFASSCLAGLMVGLSVTAACAIVKVATQDAPQHPKEHAPRGVVLCWIVAACIIPAVVVCGMLLRPLLPLSVEVGDCIEDVSGEMPAFRCG